MEITYYEKTFYTFFTLLVLLFALTFTTNVSATELPDEPTYQSDNPKLDIEKYQLSQLSNFCS